MSYHNEEINQVLKELTSSETGLTKQEALKRLKDYGPNKLEEAKKQSTLVKFFSQFNDMLIIILLFAALFSFIIALIEKHSFTDSIIIIAIVILNAILGFVQEAKSDKAIENLKKMQDSKVKVKRDNEVILISTENLVVGDILVLEAGNIISADARIIWQASLKVDESSLTGESVPVEKVTNSLKGNVPLSERFNMLYSGTSIVYGKCLAVVTATGMNTEFGIIASSLNDTTKEDTPLQKRIKGISKVISIIIAIVVITMFIIGLLQGMSLQNILMLSIALAVAAIPEGLPAIITITLSLGMSTLAKKKAIVRKMSSVETLGTTEVICSDKTGTITKNKMTIRALYFDGKRYEKEMLDKNNILLDAMTLNNDVEKSNNKYLGDPTEIALYTYCEKLIDIDKQKDKYPRIDELPFDSERKMMSTINDYNDKLTLFTKGSFDSLIKRCTKIIENGKVVKLTTKQVKELEQIENKESSKAFRVLAYAYKPLPKNYQVDNKLEEDLIFIGFTYMIDPPREEVKHSIALCKSANIKPIMITGDSLATAIAIGKEVGILESDEEAIEGVELDQYTEQEMIEVVKRYSVYARVSPLNKVAIVKAWKKNNKIVAMTGDGVNDAPSIKSADIGIGMGITGTEVSKGVADIILVDDSFSTIVTAVKEGRRIFDNIRNVLVYLLSANIAEVLVIFIGMLAGYEILLPIQILYVNLVTDSIPAIALAFEKAETNIMTREIRKKDSSFFTPFLLSKIISASIIKSAIILMIFFFSLNCYNAEVSTTLAFLALIILEMIFAFSSRDLKNTLLNKRLISNSYMNKSIIGLIVLQLIVFLTPIRHIFNIETLNPILYLYIIIMASCAFIMNEVLKKIFVFYFKD